jgi:AraC-like DNA-binding protein/ligand-binding sensor protein
MPPAEVGGPLDALRRFRYWWCMAADDKQLIQQLTGTALYRDYERAFSAATGMPLALRAVEHWQMALHGKEHENPFCARMAQANSSCAACLEVQQKLGENPGEEAKTVTCFAGLADAAVPVRVGERLIGFLQTGQVMLDKPRKAKFDRTARQLVKWGLDVDLREAQEAYFHTKVLTKKQFASMLRLLTIFGQHLSLLSNQLVASSQRAEPQAVTRARDFIAKNQGRDLSLREVAQAVNTSTYYFCKLFKKATGLTFTDYLSRVRIEKAKNLLMNPNLRVSEIAYEVGFQSLTHFNRMFRKVAGQSPSDFRESLRHASSRRARA